jgi:hypothetical protein
LWGMPANLTCWLTMENRQESWWIFSSVCIC